MKTYRSIAVALALVALAAAWLVFESRGQNKPAANPLTPAEQQYQKLLDEQAEQAKRNGVILREQEGQHQRLEALLGKQEAAFKRFEALLTKQEEFMDKQMKAAARYDKILDTWEAQQRQHQRYLDGLPKK